MIRQIEDIGVTTTSHQVGQKRVLLGAAESGCSLTQIAITELKAGEIDILPHTTHRSSSGLRFGWYITTCGKE